MGYSVRLDVENRICDEKGPRVDSFAMPQQIAFDTMNKVLEWYIVVCMWKLSCGKAICI